LTADLGINWKTEPWTSLAAPSEYKHHDKKIPRWWKGEARPKISQFASARSARQIDETTSDYDSREAAERLPSSRGVAVIMVGAATGPEMKRKARVVRRAAFDAVLRRRRLVPVGGVPLSPGA